MEPIVTVKAGSLFHWEHTLALALGAQEQSSLNGVRPMRIQISLLLATLFVISGCGANLCVNDDYTPRSNAKSSLVAFDPDNTLEAGNRRTDFGVPHFSADNLKDLAFGSALSDARDYYWLSISLAGNIDEFEQAFQTSDRMAYVNTLYADEARNAPHIDSSNVQKLNDQPPVALSSDFEIQANYNALGSYVLPAKANLFEQASCTLNEWAPQPY